MSPFYILILAVISSGLAFQRGPPPGSPFAPMSRSKMPPPMPGSMMPPSMPGSMMPPSMPGSMIPPSMPGLMMPPSMPGSMMPPAMFPWLMPPSILPPRSPPTAPPAPPRTSRATSPPTPPASPRTATPSSATSPRTATPSSATSPRTATPSSATSPRTATPSSATSPRTATPSSATSPRTATPSSATSPRTATPSSTTSPRTATPSSATSPRTATPSSTTSPQTSPPSSPTPPPTEPPTTPPAGISIEDQIAYAASIGVDWSDYQDLLKQVEKESTRRVLNVTVDGKSSFCANPDIIDSSREINTLTITVYQDKCFGKVHHTCALKDDECQQVRNFYATLKGQPVKLEVITLTAEGRVDSNESEELKSDNIIYDVKGIFDGVSGNELNKDLRYSNLLGSGKYLETVTRYVVPDKCNEAANGFNCYREYYRKITNDIFMTASRSND